MWLGSLGHAFQGQKLSLHRAAAKGQVETVKALLADGVDINAKDKVCVFIVLQGVQPWRFMLMAATLLDCRRFFFLLDQGL